MIYEKKRESKARQGKQMDSLQANLAKLAKLARQPTGKCPLTKTPIKGPSTA